MGQDVPGETEADVGVVEFNGPFEEFSIPMALSRAGIETTYPRAIYMTGRRSNVSSGLADRSRYESHADMRTLETYPLLREDHEYVTIWGYWNGPGESLAAKDEPIYQGVDALAAYWEGRLTQHEYLGVMRASKKRFAEAAIEDLNLRGSHLLLSVDTSGRLATDPQGLPLVRICNFELLRRMQSQQP
jgi:hypothetical protein